MENFVSINLTERDVEILNAVRRHRFLRSHQITRLVPGSSQQVLRRLQKLYHHRYLDRPVCQLEYYQRGGSKSIVYGLGSRGASYFRQIKNIPFSRLGWTFPNSNVKRLFLEHALMVSDIMVAMEFACKSHDAKLLLEDEILRDGSTNKEHDLFRWEVIIEGNEKVGVMPDRVFVVEFTEPLERIICFLEADRGTMPLYRSGFAKSSFRRKFAAYRATWNNSVHKVRFGENRLRVLSVTDRAERTKHLIENCAALQNGRGIFLFSTLPEIIKNDVSPLMAWRNYCGKEVSLGPQVKRFC